MIGTIETGFDTQKADPWESSGGTPTITARLIRSFVRDHIALWALQSEGVQKAFCEWLTERAKRDAAKTTIRQELKDVLRFAKKQNLYLLEVHAEKLLLDTRNNVPNLARNFDVSRFITQDTVVRLMGYFAGEMGVEESTATEYEAIQLFLLTCMTGLRTNEWKTAELILPPCDPLPGETEALPYLAVQTSKTKTDDGRMRHLILDAFSESQIESLNQSLQFFQTASAGTRSQLIVRVRSVLSRVYSGDPAALELIRTIDYRAARKIFTVESRRSGSTMKEVAAALGHTSINNVRYYNHGDISCPRQTTLPLARCPKAAVEHIKDPLEHLNKARQAQGLKAITGYPTLPDVQPTTGGRSGQRGESDSSPKTPGRNLLDNL